MKILLLGEYSGLHLTLAEGLRQLGHTVTVASDGDNFKGYGRDIDLVRKSSSLKHTGQTFYSVFRNLNNFKGYDIVQLINPCFIQLNIRINEYLYRFLRKHNKKIFLGAFGVDSYWLKAVTDKQKFRYSEFYIDGEKNNFTESGYLKDLWLGTNYERLNREIAETCNGIVACLYEYYISYVPIYKDKLTYIPLPVNTNNILKTEILQSEKIRFFIGINKARNRFKGTDRLYAGLMKLYEKYPNKTEISVAESIPYNEYYKLATSSDVVVDQLYSYGPAMNGLLALAMGKILVGGGELEMYEMLNEKVNFPIVNVLPSDEDIFDKLESIVKNKNLLPVIGDKSRKFIDEHHDYIKVARQYVDFWTDK